MNIVNYAELSWFITPIPRTRNFLSKKVSVVKISLMPEINFQVLKKVDKISRKLMKYKELLFLIKNSTRRLV